MPGSIGVRRDAERYPGRSRQHRHRRAGVILGGQILVAAVAVTVVLVVVAAVAVVVAVGVGRCWLMVVVVGG